MSLETDFEAAVARMNASSVTPGPHEQLKLYGLFKQAKFGDTTEKRPGMTQVRARAKHDAWAKNAGLSTDEAMQSYMALVDELAK